MIYDQDEQTVRLDIYNPFVKNLRGDFMLKDIRSIESNSEGKAMITLTDHSRYLVTISLTDLQKLFELKKRK